MYAIYAYIGVVLGVNVGIYMAYMECLGMNPAPNFDASVAPLLRLMIALAAEPHESRRSPEEPKALSVRSGLHGFCPGGFPSIRILEGMSF